MSALTPRDLTPEESRLYSNPSAAFTDPAVRIVFTDPESNRPILEKGFWDRKDGFVRSWKLLGRGMLIEAECQPFVLWDHLGKLGINRKHLERSGAGREPVPDLTKHMSLVPIPNYIPDFAPDLLSEYVHRFTERSIRLLNMDDCEADFVRKNQKRAISYLCKLLVHGNLRFYMGSGGDLFDDGPITFWDDTDPQKPKLLWLIYGLRPLLWEPEPPKGPLAQIPWKPCPRRSRRKRRRTKSAGKGSEK